jgi:hypothetical protein
MNDSFPHPDTPLATTTNDNGSIVIPQTPATRSEASETGAGDDYQSADIAIRIEEYREKHAHEQSAQMTDEYILDRLGLDLSEERSVSADPETPLLQSRAINAENPGRAASVEPAVSPSQESQLQPSGTDLSVAISRSPTVRLDIQVSGNDTDDDNQYGDIARQIEEYRAKHVLEQSAQMTDEYILDRLGLDLREERSVSVIPETPLPRSHESTTARKRRAGSAGMDAADRTPAELETGSHRQPSSDSAASVSPPCGRSNPDRPKRPKLDERSKGVRDL